MTQHEGFIEGAEALRRLRHHLEKDYAQRMQEFREAVASAEYWKGEAMWYAHRVKVLEAEVRARSAAQEQLSRELNDERNRHDYRLGLDSRNAVDGDTHDAGDAADHGTDLQGRGAG